MTLHSEVIENAHANLDVPALHVNRENESAEVSEVLLPHKKDFVFVERWKSLEIAKFDCDDSAANTILTVDPRSIYAKKIVNAVLGGGKNTNAASVFPGRLFNGISLDGVVDFLNFNDVIQFLISTAASGVFGWFRFDDTSLTFKTLFSFGDTSLNTKILCRTGSVTGTLACACVDNGVTQWNFQTNNIVVQDNKWHLIFFGHDSQLPWLWVDSLEIKQSDLTYSSTVNVKKWFSTVTAGLDNAHVGSELHSGAPEALHLSADVDSVRYVGFFPNLDQHKFLWNNKQGTDVPLGYRRKEAVELQNLQFGKVKVLDIIPPGSLAATAGTLVGGSVPTEQVGLYNFDDTVNEYLDLLCHLEDYKGNGLEFTFPWSALASIAGNVKWDAAIRRLEDDNVPLAGAHVYAFQSVTAVAPTVLSENSVDTISFEDGAEIDNLQSGEYFILRIRRDTGVGGNMVGDAQLWAGRMEGQESAT